MALEDTLNALKKIIYKLNDANVSAIRLDNTMFMFLNHQQRKNKYDFKDDFKGET